jgi:hypothetical protein
MKAEYIVNEDYCLYSIAIIGNRPHHFRSTHLNLLAAAAVNELAFINWHVTRPDLHVD